MEIGIVGLGRMGAGMARRLARRGAHVICYDQSEAARKAVAGEPKVDCAENLAALCARLSGERVILIMLPAGDAVENTVKDLLPLCSSGDTLIDGGNSYYRDSMRRAMALSQQGLRYVDAGVSGGVHGLEHGYCLMLGGTPRSIEIFEPFSRLLAADPERGWLHCGPSGAGHYSKMVHNGIEYGMMQALAEGFSLLAAHPELDIDSARLAQTWRHGSVVRSWLVDLLAREYAARGGLDAVPGTIEDTGEVSWLVADALRMEVPIPVIAHSVMELLASRDEQRLAYRAIAVMRHGFGGHAVGRHPEVARLRHVTRLEDAAADEEDAHPGAPPSPGGTGPGLGKRG
jgi:6-phosphogluconate dehydrogenase